MNRPADPPTPAGSPAEPQFARAMYETLDGPLGSRRSARAIVPLVLDLVRPASVADIGCGVGSWLSVIAEHGLSDFLGVDSPHVDPALLVIPRDRFFAHDLRRPLAAPRRFDLVLNLEVAADLPAKQAPAFVETLTRWGDAILFSAAIPHQAGPRRGRVNQQWPTYWADLFARHGYAALDPFRRTIWNHPDVAWWYAQNLLLFVSEPRLAADPRLEAARRATDPAQLSLVHPSRYLATFVLRSLAESFPGALARAFRRRLGLRVDEPGPF